ncbi:MAG: hypothetical protein Q9226_003900 [Calogaya cf. arnoldii]
MSQTNKRGRPPGSRNKRINNTSSVVAPRPDVPPDQQHTDILLLLQSMVVSLHEIKLHLSRNPASTPLQPSRTPAAPPAEQKRAQKAFVRCLLGTADNKAVDNITDNDIVHTFDTRGDIWSHVKVIRRKPTCFELRLDSSEHKREIEKRAEEVSDILQLPGRCRALTDNYLVVAKNFDFGKETLAAPDDGRLSEWSRITE